MTVLIELPGVLASTAGLERITTTLRGFPDAGLADLFMFEDAAGTVTANTVLNRPSGLIEKINAGKYTDTFAWLGGSGGLQVQGTQIVSMPEFVPTEPWSLVYLGAVTGSLSDAAEAITAMIAFRDRSFAAVRGPLLLARAFQAGGVGRHQVRAWQGSTDGVATDLVPGATGTVGQHRVAILSYDGSAVVKASIYDKTGALMTSASVSVSDAGMTTSGSQVVASVKPAIGISNTTYDGGIQQIEAFARYSRVLSADDITRICANGAAVGASRGRPW